MGLVGTEAFFKVLGMCEKHCQPLCGKFQHSADFSGRFLFSYIFMLDFGEHVKIGNIFVF